MEGPSLVIASEEFKIYQGLKVKSATGTAKIPFGKIKGKKFLSARSWGKHFLLSFQELDLRIHFLMFGSYRLNKQRENRIPKMTLKFVGSKDVLYFYSCAIKVLDEKPEEIYDWSTDTMSDQWDPAKALKAVAKAKPDRVCDVLMNQEIFTGVGNIIKNEVLFLMKLHPEVLISDLSGPTRKKLINQTRAYCLQFYEWKKQNVLKRNWKIFRKKECPVCGAKVKKEKTGKLQRVSHYCPKCQNLKKSLRS